MKLRLTARLKKLVLLVILLLLFISFYIFTSYSIINTSTIQGRYVSKIPTASFRLVPKQAVPDRGKIPKIIHQTWNSTDSLPETFRGWIESFLKHNKDWEYWLWTDADMKHFISSIFPQYLTLYESYPAQGYRSDAFRYFVLYAHGGVYADLDMECVKPLQLILTPTDTCVMSQEPLEHVYLLSDSRTPPLVSNAFMAATPRHQFLAAIINQLPKTTGVLRWNNILHATGPPMITDVYINYLHKTSSRTESRSEDLTSVRMADPEVFHPSVDSSMVNHMQSKCLQGHRAGEGVVKSLCDRILMHNFGRSLDAKAVTLHHWTHTWAGRKVDPWGLIDMRTRFNVAELRTDNHILFNHSISPDISKN